MSHFSIEADAAPAGAANHPLALRMGVIAFLSYNLSLACMYGTFGVFLTTVEAKFGVARDVSSVGVSLLMAGMALTSPVAGILVQKFSLRLLMMTGAALNLIGYVILALSDSIWVNLATYALVFGPGFCLTVTVLPATLITRWYAAHRGRALGIMSMPILLVFAAPLAATVLKTYGLSISYGLVACVMGVALIIFLFIVDFPPGSPTAGSTTTAASADMTVPQLLRRPAFWAMSLAAATLASSANIFNAHLVSMVAGWGVEPTRAAAILAGFSTGGMAGSLFFGWLADRLGGTRTLALLCFGIALVTTTLLLQPPYFAMWIIAAFLGSFAAAVLSVFSIAVAQKFGAANFSRAFGLGMSLALPFNLLGVPLAARVYVMTGSYAGAMIGLAVVAFAAGVLVLATRQSGTDVVSRIL